MSERSRASYSTIANNVIHEYREYCKEGPQLCETAQQYVQRRLVKSSLTSTDVHNIGELVAGMYRYSDVCMALLNGYFEGRKRGKQEDTEALLFVCYLCLYRYGEVSAGEIAAFIAHVTHRIRLEELVDFLTDCEMLITFAAPQLVKVVQDAYVEDFIIPTLLENAPALRTAICNSFSHPDTSNVDYVSMQVGTQKALARLASEEMHGDDERAALIFSCAEQPSADVEKCNAYVNLSDQGPPSSATIAMEKMGHITGGGKTSTSKSNKIPPHEVREMAMTFCKPVKSIVRNNTASRKVIGGTDNQKGSFVPQVSNKTKKKLEGMGSALGNSRQISCGGDLSLGGTGDCAPQENHPDDSSLLCPLQKATASEPVKNSNSTCISQKSLATRFRALPVPTCSPQTYKNNTAGLLREYQILMRQREAEAAELAVTLESLQNPEIAKAALLDSAAAAERERMQHVLALKTAAVKAYEEARSARLAEVRRRALNARQMRETMGELQRTSKRKDKRYQAQLKWQVAQRRAGLKDGIEAAANANCVLRAEAARQLREENLRLEAEHQKEEEHQRAQRVALLEQARQEQARRCADKAAAGADLPGWCGAGGAVADSDIDVRQALAEMRVRESRELLEKRSEIAHSHARLRERLASIEAAVQHNHVCTERKRKNNRLRSQAEAKAAAAAAAAEEEARVLALQERLWATRIERLRREECLLRANQAQQLDARQIQAVSLDAERRRLGESDKAAERRAAHSQHAALNKRHKEALTAARETAQRQINLLNGQNLHANERTASDMAFSKKRVIVDEERENEFIAKRTLIQQLNLS